jgi:hypothetical protein
MTARTARRNKDDAGYDQERQTFMRTYGTQISKYNLYTKLNEIFNLFSDINYNEPAFDKDYLGQSASGDYLKSIENKMKTDASLAKVTTVSEPPATISATTSFDPYDELSALEESLQDVRRNIVSLNEAKIDYQKQMRVINRNLEKIDKLDYKTESDTRYEIALRDSLAKLTEEVAKVDDNIEKQNDNKRIIKEQKESIKMIKDEIDKRYDEGVAIEKLEANARKLEKEMTTSKKDATKAKKATDLEDVTRKIERKIAEVEERQREWASDNPRLAPYVDGTGPVVPFSELETGPAGAGAGAGAAEGKVTGEDEGIPDVLHLGPLDSFSPRKTRSRSVKDILSDVADTIIKRGSGKKGSKDEITKFEQDTFDKYGRILLPKDGLLFDTLNEAEQTAMRSMHARNTGR